jgi:beta-glucosidase
MKDRIQDLINKMTDEEKASMLIGLVCLVLTGQPYNLPKEKKPKCQGQRVGLPPYKTRIPSTIVADGPAGLHQIY